MIRHFEDSVESQKKKIQERKRKVAHLSTYLVYLCVVGPGVSCSFFSGESAL